MKALVLLPVALVLLGCASSPDADEIPLAQQASALTISDTATIPYPVYEITTPGQEVRSNWNGTLVDLLAADALGICTPRSLLGAIADPTDADRYLSYLKAQMDSAVCGTPLGLPSAALNWMVQRTDAAYLNCNYRGSTEGPALLALPAGSDADDVLYTPATDGNYPPRWQAYQVHPLSTPPSGPEAPDSMVEAERETLVAAINLCMANRLREQMHTLDILSTNGAEQRQLLVVIRERVQIAMLQLTLLMRALGNADAGSVSVTDANMLLPALRKHYESLTPAERKQLATDFAASVRLHTEVTRELTELLVRSGGARSDLSNLGVAGFPSEFDDVEWGPGGWRSRTLAVLYGGDPIGSLYSENPMFPVSSNSIWGYFTSFPFPSPGERILTASLSQPEVQTLFGLAREADVLYLRQTADGVASYDLEASGHFIWQAVEAHLRNLDCEKDPLATCDLKADSSEIASVTSYEEALLWQRYRIAPEHGVALAGALIQGTPPPPGLFAGQGPFHITGPIVYVESPARDADDAGLASSRQGLRVSFAPHDHAGLRSREQRRVLSSRFLRRRSLRVGARVRRRPGRVRRSPSS